MVLCQGGQGEVHGFVGSWGLWVVRFVRLAFFSVGLGSFLPPVPPPLHAFPSHQILDESISSNPWAIAL